MMMMMQMIKMVLMVMVIMTTLMMLMMMRMMMTKMPLTQLHLLVPPIILLLYTVIYQEHRQRTSNSSRAQQFNKERRLLTRVPCSTTEPKSCRNCGGYMCQCKTWSHWLVTRALQVICPGHILLVYIGTALTRFGTRTSALTKPFMY